MDETMATSAWVNLTKSVDGGLSWAARLPTGAASADILTSLRCSAETPALVWVYDRVTADLYKSINACEALSWSTLDAAMDFDLADLVPQVDDDDVFIIADKDAAAVMVEYTVNEAVAWSDGTGDLPVADGATRLLWPRLV